MSKTLMPRATAIWLIENTSLTFQQIADFCGLHILEIESLANNEIGTNLVGCSPITSSQLTSEEIHRCEADPNATLQLKIIPELENYNTKQRKYTPKAKRNDKPNAILWLIKYYPEIPDKDICDLIGTTTRTVHSIRNKTYKNISTLTPRDPAVIGLCTSQDLEFCISKLKRE